MQQRIFIRNEPGRARWAVAQVGGVVLEREIIKDSFLMHIDVEVNQEQIDGLENWNRCDVLEDEGKFSGCMNEKIPS